LVGAGSSGTQTADDLSRAGRSVYLRVGQHTAAKPLPNSLAFTASLAALRVSVFVHLEMAPT
jgi:cation diffusion facilitator CzcD-associated flavoprotein CzcO